MFYLFIQCENRGSGYYLPQATNWSGRVELDRALTPGARKIELPFFITDGVTCVDVPEGFRWADGVKGARELLHSSKISLLGMDTQLDIFVAKVERKSTRLQKYALSAQPVTIGREEGNVVRYDQKSVSRSHATLMRRADGTCQYTDHSSGGSFINGRLCRGVSAQLRFGDMVMILPALVLVFLGDCLAVSCVDGLTVASSLMPYAPPASRSVRGGQESSVIHEYHRSPRHLQKAHEEKLEIEPPIERERQKELPAWLAIGPSFTMVLPMLMSGIVTGRSVASSIVMIGTSSALAVMWATINRKYQKRSGEMNEQRRQQVCAQYYAEIEERLNAATEREKSRLMYNHMSVMECVDVLDRAGNRLWERTPQHSDFLTVRLGLGERPLPVEIDVKQVRMALIDDPLRHEPQRLYDTYSMIRDVPVLFPLMEHRIVGILGSRLDPWLMQSILVQTAANHSYHDVRVAVLHTREDAALWAFAKWLPHVFATDERTLRMVVSEENAMAEVLGHIDSMLTMRQDMMQQDGREETDTPLPWYLILCTDPALLEDSPILRHISCSGLGFTIIMQASTVEMLPKECSAIIEARDRLGAIYRTTGEMEGVRFEAATGEKLMAFSRAMARMRIKESVENSAIPSLVTFLETYHVRSVEELDILYFWNENHAYNSVKARLGMKAGNTLFTLDISDKNHGPHGLIAGTTGAGKSVLLQSFILSLAINYSPTEVQFILIDYKGGGTSESFRNLPHAAGVIDQLQGERMIFRALASIKGEILRREEMFKRGGVNNIDDYMKYYNNEPGMEALGHLIIIVDEFAELKKEQPEFMHELVSAARVGRSLGMHLVLATQKPSNSVSDEIAANTRFRICLRVASKSDSSEMLKRPEAAYLKGMGRCYVQVGNDEVFEQVQTSYSGAKYAPNALRSEEEPRILNEAGQPIRLKRKMSEAVEQKIKDEKTELKAVLDRLDEVCLRYHIDRARKMWLEELRENLLLEEIDEVTASCFDGETWPQTDKERLLGYVGLADDIQMQRYLPVAMDFTAEKNQIIVGLAGAGKTTMLQTLAVSLALRYPPDMLNLYVFSLTSRTLSCLSALPHVGEIVYENEPDEQVRLMEMLLAESERRKKLFADMATDYYTQYNRAVSAAGRDADRVPAIVVLIDRMQQLRDWVNQRKEDKLQIFYDLLSSANSQGIYFVLTAFDKNELPIKYQPYVNGIALQLSERINYSDALSARIPMEWGGIRSHVGRGMIAIEDKEAKKTNIYEIQTAVYGTLESDAKRTEMIQTLGEKMHRAWRGAKPKGIARIPEKPTLQVLLSDERMREDMARIDRLPLCYDKNTGEARSIDLREQFSMLICGPRKSGKTNMLRCMATTFAKKGAVVHVVGSPELAQWANEQGMNGYEHGSQSWADIFMSAMNAEIKIRSGKLSEAREKGGAKARSAMLAAFTPIVLLIDDLDVYIDKYEKIANMSANLKHYLADIVSGYGIYTFAAVSHAGYMRAKLKEPMPSFSKAKRGVMLQGKLNECDPFDVQMPFAKKNQSYPVGEGLMVFDGEAAHVVFPRWDEEKGSETP